MGYELREVISHALTQRMIKRRRFVQGMAATAGALGSPLMLSNMVEAASTNAAVAYAASAATSLPPVVFPGTGIGADFTAYAPPAAPFGYHLMADVYDHLYFPGQKASLTLNFTNPGGPPPSPWVDADVGSVNAKGAVFYGNGVFTVNGSGDDIWGNADAFHYVYQPLTGDGTIIARVTSVQGTDSWAKVGVMMRDSLNADAANAFLPVTGGNGVVFQWRDTDGGGSSNNILPALSSVAAPYWVKLVRSGSTFTASASSDGTTWIAAGSATVNFTGSTAYVGLAVTAHNNGAINSSTFDNVSVNGVATTGPGTGGAQVVSGTIQIAFATEVVADTNGGVQLTPVNVVQTITVPPTNVPAGGTGTFSFGFDASNPNILKGVYAVYATLQNATSTPITAWLGNIGVIYAPTPGFKPNSFFMCDTRSGSSDTVSMNAEAVTMSRMGVKWCRNGIGWDQQEATKGTYDWSVGDQILNVMQKNEMYVLWLTIGSPDWARDGVTYPVRTTWNAPDNAIPDDHLADWQNYWAAFMQHYKGSVIKAINVWNEPWEGGGISGWGGTALTYRKMITGVWNGVKSVDPTMPVGGDDSDDNINDTLLPDPNWPKFFDLATQHGYGTQGYYMQKLLPFPVWNTESWYWAQTFQIVHETMFTLAGGRAKVNNVVLGNFFSNAGVAGGYYAYDPKSQFSPMPSAITYSTMTHFLEDTKYVGEPHPARVPHVFLFSGQNKNTAVVFGFPFDAGDFPNWQITGAGTMTLFDPFHLIQAWDAYGNPYTRQKDGSYNLPFDVTPIFLTSGSIDVLRVATELIEVTKTTTPVKIVLDDIVQPLASNPDLHVTITNVLHLPTSASVDITLPAGWTAKQTHFDLPLLLPELPVPLTVHLTAAASNTSNKYPVTVTVKTPQGTMTWKESIEVHVIPRGTPNITSSSVAVDEWNRLGVTPITIGDPTATAYAQAGMSYDDHNLYFITAVHTPNNNPPFDQTGTWYTLIPPGYGYADGPHWPFDGDNVQLGINCYENTEDYLYPKSNPYHYRFPSRETDYLFGFYQPKGTAGQVWRYRIPGMPWRHRYPFSPQAAVQQIVDPDIKLTVTQSGTVITYWATIPRTLLAKLNISAGAVTKLAVKLSNSNVGDVHSGQGRSSTRSDVQAFQPYFYSPYSIDTLWGFA